MKTVLYITFIDFGNFSSGSTVRPQMMYRAFQEAGLNVVLLKGSQETIKKAQRRKNVREINTWLDHNRPDFCYIEPPSYPILYSFDIRLIKRIHKMGIPTAYYFRDAHHKLGKEFLGKSKKSLERRIKDLLLKLLNYRNEKLLYKNVDIVYFPTKTMASYFSYKDMRPLPPAGEDFLPQFRSKTCTGIYVGGISRAYGTDILLESYEMLNDASPNKQYHLILVCRESEMQAIDPKYLEKDWLEIHHASGDEELMPLYRRADVGLSPRINSQYNELALSVKLFEYMSYGLPIIASRNKETKKLIDDYKIGVAADFSVKSFAQAVESVFEDDTVYQTYAMNVRRALLQENLWVHRAKTIQTDLLKGTIHEEIDSNYR